MKRFNLIEKAEYNLANDITIFYLKDKGYVFQFKHKELFYMVDSHMNVYLSVGFWFKVNKHSLPEDFFQGNLDDIIKLCMNTIYSIKLNMEKFLEEKFLEYSPRTHVKFLNNRYYSILELDNFIKNLLI